MGLYPDRETGSIMVASIENYGLLAEVITAPVADELSDYNWGIVLLSCFIDIRVCDVGNVENMCFRFVSYQKCLRWSKIRSSCNTQVKSAIHNSIDF